MPKIAKRPRNHAIDTSAPTLNRTLVSRPHPDDQIDPAKPRPALRRSVRVNVKESAIAWLHHRKMISDAQMAAAEKLRGDYERGGLGARVTMGWDAAPRSRQRSVPVGPDCTAAQIDAKRRFQAAVDAVGPGMSDICWRLICANETMGEAETALGWPARSGRVVLGLALDRLVRFYGISGTGRGCA